MRDHNFILFKNNLMAGHLFLHLQKSYFYVLKMLAEIFFSLFSQSKNKQKGPAMVT